MRRRAWPPAFLAISAALAGCTPYLTASDTEQSMAASCRAWEERAAKAAHPDAEAIARHDRLMAKAAQFKAQALANYKRVVSDLAEMVDAAQPKPGKRGPYKKQAA